MKWATCDINVLECAKTSKFSKLDYIVSPLRLHELFFDNLVVDMMFGCINLYSRESKHYLLIKKFAYFQALYVLLGTISFRQ